MSNELKLPREIHVHFVHGVPKETDKITLVWFLALILLLILGPFILTYIITSYGIMFGAVALAILFYMFIFFLYKVSGIK